MYNLRTFLFIFLLTAVNPNGSNLAEFYTYPKQLIFGLIVLLNLCQYRHWRIHPGTHKLTITWLLFLTSALISTINAPWLPDAVFGQSEMGDGYLWWVVCCCFSLSQLSLARYIRREDADILGIRIAGLIISVSAVIGWLFSGMSFWIFRLYSHPAHAAVVIAMCASLETGWILGLEIISLFLLGNRASIIALFIAKARKLRHKFPRWWLAIPMIVLVIGLGYTRELPNQTVLNQFSSGRLYQYHLSQKRIGQRPLFGWGFPGYRQAYPYFNPELNPYHIGRGIFYAPKLHTYKPIPTSKAHNLILDKLLSLGIVGSFLYFYLIWLYWSLNPKYKAPIIVYLVWSMFWYDSAQFTGLFWFFLSLPRAATKTKKPKTIPGSGTVGISTNGGCHVHSASSVKSPSRGS